MNTPVRDKGDGSPRGALVSIQGRERFAWVPARRIDTEMHQLLAHGVDHDAHAVVAPVDNGHIDRRRSGSHRQRCRRSGSHRQRCQDHCEEDSTAAVQVGCVNEMDMDNEERTYACALAVVVPGVPGYY